MRVLHLWDNYAPGLFDHSLEACREANIPAAIVCMNLIDRDTDTPPGLRFVRRVEQDRPAQNLAARIARKIRMEFDTRRFQRLVENEVRRFNPRVLHIHYGTTGALLSASTAVRRLPFVISFYGFDISQGPEIPRVRDSYRRLFILRPLIHILCDEAAQRVIALGGDRDRIVDANLPLPVQRYPDIGIDGDRISRWLIPARFVEKKGHEILLQAFRSRLADWPDDRLTCWGYGDSNWLERRISDLGLGDRVKVINNRGRGDFDDAYIEQLRHHDVVLAPSVRANRGDDEGGPALTAVLAQVAGKPVIVSDFPGHERSVTDAVEGLVVPQGDAAALAAAMARLAADPGLARRMGQAGRVRASREFNPRKYRDALLDWYRRLAE
jgi:glycosyltransferase involved in cell wall biosynthesis